MKTQKVKKQETMLWALMLDSLTTRGRSVYLLVAKHNNQLIQVASSRV